MAREVVNGILLLDKPLGISSNAALQKTKYLLNAKKAGHTGCLDPQASGMLPVCFGEATKFSRFLIDEKKSYQVTIRFGVTTTTGDSEGEVLAVKPVPAFNTSNIAQMVSRFVGVLQQIPPMYSAIKIQGQRLYQLARQGKTVPRAAREITIYDLIWNDDPAANDETTLSFTVICSKGTYIRTLAEDMGEYLGCGAHVVTLRRLWVSPFLQNNMHTLPDLEKLDSIQRRESLLPMQAVLSLLLPSVRLENNMANLLQKGQIVSPILDEKLKGWVLLIIQEDDEFFGVGEILEDGRIAARRLLSCN